MFPKRIDRRQLDRLMRQMGIKTRELQGVREVRIRLVDKEIVIPNAGVVVTEVAGQKSYQVTGHEIEQKLEYEPSEEDVKLVMEQAGADAGEARKELRETRGDLAEAILRIKEKKERI